VINSSLKTYDSKTRKETFLDQFCAGIRLQIINRLLVCWNYIEKLISERKYRHINFISYLSWLLGYTSCALLIKFRICVQRTCSYNYLGYRDMLKITNIFPLRLGCANPHSGVIGEGGGECAHHGIAESNGQRTRILQIKKKQLSALNAP
jgi:hypothetical protein